jgi:uncharacterized damage-inducible protein DinB
MSALEEIRFWYAYNSHARKKYLRAILQLPEVEVLKDRGTSYPSILDIFVHVLDGYRYYFFVVKDGQPEKAYSPWRGHISIDQLKKREKEVDREIMGSVNSLTEEGLNRKVMSGAFEMRDVLNHMIEEELQHRGELNAIFWQININPPIVDIDDAKYIKMHLSGQTCPLCES